MLPLGGNMEKYESVALDRSLLPLQEILKDPNVNEITINKPHEYIIEKPNGKEHVQTEDFSLHDLKDMARLIGSYTNQKVDEKHPMLSGRLPSGERVQIVMPPAVANGQFAMSIRSPSTLNLKLDNYEANGSFDNVKTDHDQYMTPTDQILLDLKNSGNIGEFLRQSVRLKKNIIVSGGTSSGKTTFTNALVNEIPLTERLITIEDVQEVQLPHEDKLNLLYSKGGQGTAQITCKEALEACLRLNPSRILLSELRGEEAFYYLRAINSGHPGSITTLHADTVSGAFDQIVMMINQGGINLSEENIRAYLKKVCDVVVQFKNINGRRVMTELYFDPPGERRSGVNTRDRNIHEHRINTAIKGITAGNILEVSGHAAG